MVYRGRWMAGLLDSNEAGGSAGEEHPILSFRPASLNQPFSPGQTSGGHFLLYESIIHGMMGKRRETGSVIPSY